jgi:hypothetical protein
MMAGLRNLDIFPHEIGANSSPQSPPHHLPTVGSWVADGGAGTTMADDEVEPDCVQSYCQMLNSALLCFDKAGLHQAAAYVDMALNVLEKQALRPATGLNARKQPLH